MHSRLNLNILLAVALVVGNQVCAEPVPSVAAAPSQELAEPQVNSNPNGSQPMQGNVEQKSNPADPLVGGAEQKVMPVAPIQGGVEQKVMPIPPLQGGVEQKVAAPVLQPGVAKFGSDPLRGAVDQSCRAPLQGGVDQSARQPLQGAVQDSQRNPLQGRVNDQGVSLGARTPSFSAVMRIIQIKKTDAVPVVKPPPITEDEIQKARHRDDANFSKIPARAEEVTQSRPVRGDTAGGPPREALTGGRPQRTALSVPQRSEPGAPSTRALLSVDAPPIRPEEGGWLTPPSRLPLDNQAPSSRVELNPAINLSRPAVGANIRPGQDDSRILQPPSGNNLALTAQPANPDGFQEKVKKKKRDKKTDLVAKPNAAAQAVPELAASADEMLLWDRWYQHVNDLVCVALRTTLPRHGNPAGTNRVHITVWADHRIEPRLVESNNPNFDQAILEAYKSLNGSAELEFPKGTHRKQNDYETAHIQEIPAATAAFDSRTVRGDLETLVK